jgi:hypothetical protein
MTRPTSSSRLNHPSGDLLTLADAVPDPTADPGKLISERRYCGTCARVRHGMCVIENDSALTVDENVALVVSVRSWVWRTWTHGDKCGPRGAAADGCPGWRPRTP